VLLIEIFKTTKQWPPGAIPRGLLHLLKIELLHLPPPYFLPGGFFLADLKNASTATSHNKSGRVANYDLRVYNTPKGGKTCHNL
jgi:hypothetical protein